MTLNQRSPPQAHARSRRSQATGGRVAEDGRGKGGAGASSSQLPTPTSARSVSSRSRSAAVTLMPPVRPSSMSPCAGRWRQRSPRRRLQLHWSDAPIMARARVPTRRRRRRASGRRYTQHVGSPAIELSKEVGAADSLMTSTPTMAAMPMAIPACGAAPLARGWS